MSTEKFFELQTLIFNETKEARTFFSNDFNFILDKVQKFSICYGSDGTQTPMYDPLSPQEIDLYVDENFNLAERIIMLNRLLNVNEENNNDLISISTISNINVIINDIFINNVNEIINLIDYLKSFGFFVHLKVPYSQVKSSADIFRLKIFKNENILFDVNEFNAKELIETLNLILSKNINVSYNFYISNKNYKEFCELLSLNFPANTFSNIIFEKPMLKKNKEEIIDKIGDRSIFTICNTRTMNNTKLKYRLIKPYQDGLFKCYISLIDNNVKFDLNEDGINFSEIENINSYWNSDLFRDFRYSIVTQKYEEN